MDDSQKKWDAFISHASEDKDAFVRPLAVALRALGVLVWYDEFSLKAGESLSRSIDRGLAGSRYGLVVIGPYFLSKPWPEYELRGLVAREIDEDRVILPIWYRVTRKQVLAFSPPLADKIAFQTEGITAQDLAIQILRDIRRDLYAKHPRSSLEKLVSGEAIRELQEQMESVQEELRVTREQLSEFQCPFCGSDLVGRTMAPIDPEQKDWDEVVEYACGHQIFAGVLQYPCSSDPKFPKFEDFELNFREHDGEWTCIAIGKTKMAEPLHLSEPGTTKEEAAARVRARFDSIQDGSEHLADDVLPGLVDR